MDKKNLLITVLISVIVSMIASLIGCMVLIRNANGLNLSINDFTVSDISYNEDTDEYFTSYEGEARIYCQDISQPYILVVRTTLVSGGMSENIGKEQTGIVIIDNGVGTVSTYDYGEIGDITQPNYKIEILGFRTLSQ